MYGGMAALGALAYRAYGDWQRKRGAGAAATPPDRLPAPQAEQHSSAVLTAMIGAAKADGHIGPEERGLLETELARLSSDASDRSWLEAELARPLIRRPSRPPPRPRWPPRCTWPACWWSTKKASWSVPTWTSRAS